MRYCITLLLLVSFHLTNAQTANQDTTVFDIVDEMPRFPACEKLDTTIEFKSKCAQQQLLKFVNTYVVYPMEARTLGAEGMVVIKFVVEKDGSISSPKIVKDVDGGCGNEVLRVVNEMNRGGIKWIPGKKDGKVVRSRFTLPIRFKLQELPPYVMINGDSIWTKLDKRPAFQGGEEGLLSHINDNLEFPKSGMDSCLLGNIDMKLKIDRNGQVSVLEMVDLNNLGFDFWFEATNAVISTSGKWEVAELEGKSVPTSYDISIAFVPKEASCKQKLTDYEKAVQLANESQELFKNNEIEAGFEKINASIEMFPKFPEFLFIRGQAYLNQSLFKDACNDFTEGQLIGSVDWYDSVIELICKENN